MIPDKLKNVGTFALSISLFFLGGSIIYTGWEVNQLRKALPEILELTGQTADKITPAIDNISDIGKLVPPILEEVAATRKTVEETVKEVRITREKIPGILKDVIPITQQIENTSRQLPQTIDPVLAEVGKTRALVPEILKEIRNSNAAVEKAVEEVGKTREALPGFLDQADQIVSKAQKIGENAGKGAATGFVGGILSMPFNVVGGIGKGVLSLLGEEKGKYLTEKDIKMIESSVIELAEKGDTSQSNTWKNKESGNSGKNSLLKKYEETGKMCRQVKIEIFIKGKTPSATLLSGCKLPDGTWNVTEESLLNN